MSNDLPLLCARYGISLGIVIWASAGFLPTRGGLAYVGLRFLGALVWAAAGALRAANWGGVTERLVAHYSNFSDLAPDRQFRLQRTIGVLAVAGALVAMALLTVMINLGSH